MRIILKITVFLISLTALLAYAQDSQHLLKGRSSYTVCFTPGENCTEIIVHAIDNAKKSIFVQAYSFTSFPIANALAQAKNRGVAVQILLDKSNIHSRYSVLNLLKQNQIPFWIDYRPAIAHNKVMIIDKNEVVTGSFNFTKSAQIRNAENALIIKNRDLANSYFSNFVKRKSASMTLPNYLERRSEARMKKYYRK